MRRITSTLILIAAVALTGCSQDRATWAETVDVPSTSQSSMPAEPMTEPAPQPEPADLAREALTQEQVDAALLTVAELPTGYSPDASNDGDDTTDTTEPAQCAQIFRGLEDSQAAVFKGEANFTAGGFGPLLSQTIGTYESSTEGVVGAFIEAVSTCAAFTSIDAEGVRTEFTASALSFPNVGDATAATRLNASTRGFDLVYVVVSPGHNGMTLAAGGLEPMPGADLNATARAAVARISAAAAA